MTTRKTSARGTNGKTTATWNPAGKLRTPKPKLGYSHRWINVDTARLDEALEQGYSLVERPEEDRKDAFGRQMDGDKARFYIYKDLVLAQIPTELVEARTAYYDEQTDFQSDSVLENYQGKGSSRVPSIVEF